MDYYDRKTIMSDEAASFLPCKLSMNKALESGLVSNGDVVVITGGSPIGMSGTTNILKVQNIGGLYDTERGPFS